MLLQIVHVWCFDSKQYLGIRGQCFILIFFSDNSHENLHVDLSASPSTAVTFPKGVKYSPLRKKEKLTANQMKQLEPTTKLVYLNV